MTTSILPLAVLLSMVALASVFSAEDKDIDDDGDYDLEDEAARGRRGFTCKKMGSICFDATHFNVSEIVKKQGFCDNFLGGHEEYELSHRHICPHQHPYCCVDCETSEQTQFCHRKRKHGSVSRRTCCGGELFFGSARLGCKCCKKCKRRPLCRLRHGFCVNHLDPFFNVENCLAGFPNTTYAGDYIIKKRACAGIGCFCCAKRHISPTSTQPPVDNI